MVSVSNKAFEHLAAFRGYGNPAGKYWFIGLEEGVRAEKQSTELEKRILLRQEIDIRSKWRKVEDTHDARDSLGIPIRARDNDWYAMARIILRLEGVVGWKQNEMSRPYKESRLGRLDGDTFMTELFPLPTSDHSPENWPYNRPYADRYEYESEVLPPRVKMIRSLWTCHKPRFVFCYGKGNQSRSTWDQFRHLFCGSYEPKQYSEHDIQIARVGSSVVVLTHHLSWLNVNPQGEIADAAKERDTDISRS